VPCRPLKITRRAQRWSLARAGLYYDPRLFWLAPKADLRNDGFRLFWAGAERRLANDGFRLFGLTPNDDFRITTSDEGSECANFALLQRG